MAEHWETQNSPVKKTHKNAAEKQRTGRYPGEREIPTSVMPPLDENRATPAAEAHSTMTNAARPKMASSAALVLMMLVRCSGFTMTASPKSPPTSRAGFLKSILVGVSAASVVAARPTVESAEAAAEPLVETCEMRCQERGEKPISARVFGAV